MVRASVAEGAGNHVFPAYHSQGIQWGLYQARIPMAWEITTGNPDVFVLVEQNWISPDAEAYGQTNGVGLSSTNTQNNGDGRADLVMRLYRKQTDGLFQLMEDVSQNSSNTGNILVYEEFENASQEWIPSTGQLTNGSGLGNITLRLSDYGHGLGTLSILAARHNGKGMLGIAPGCSYLLRSGSNTAPFGGNAIDCNPTAPGVQMPHIVVANHYEPMSGVVNQSVFPAVHNLSFYPYQYTPHLTDDDCFPITNRRDQTAWLDTRAILAGVYNDGELKVSAPCTNFDKRISLGKTYFSDNSDGDDQQYYYYWDGTQLPQGSTLTPNNVLYKPATNCGTSWTETENCYQISSPVEIRDNIGGEWSQYPDVVVPSDLFFEVNGEYYVQQQTDQSYVIAFVNGILALMRSVDVTGGINLTSQTLGSRPSNDGISVCSNPLTVYTNTNLGVTNQYCTPAELTRRMRDVLTFTARQVPNSNYTYTKQVGDVLQRAWALNTGYGMVDAYRSVAHSIPAKGAYSYSGSEAIDFTNATTINSRQFIHLGAWGRNVEGSRQLLFDNQAFGFTPAGQPSTIQVGRTTIGSGVFTVGSSNTLCIDGELELDPNATLKSASNTDGRIMVSGYLSPNGEVGGRLEGNLTIGDLVVRSCTVTCSPSSNQACRLYGTISIQFQGKLLLNAPGVTYAYPGSQIHLWGSNDLVVEGEGTILDLDYGTSIVAKEPTRKVIVRNGGIIRLRKGAGAVNIDADIVIESGGKLELGSEDGFSTIVNVKSLKVKTGGMITIKGRGGIEPVIGQSEHVVVELEENTTISMQPSAHFDLTYAMLKMNAGSTIGLQSPQGDTLTLGGLDAASGISGSTPTPPARIDVKGKNVLHLAAQTGSSFVMRGLLVVEGDPNNRAIVQAKLMNGICSSTPQVAKLRIEGSTPIFTGVNVPGPDQTPAVNTGFRADRARFENVYISLINCPILSGASASTQNGFGSIDNCEFIANRNLIKGLTGFTEAEALLTIATATNNIAPAERAQALNAVGTVSIQNCLFKDLHGLYSPVFYFNTTNNEELSRYQIVGLSTTGLSSLAVSSCQFGYLVNGVLTVGQYGGNTVTNNVFVHSLRGIRDIKSQNWICSNVFSDVAWGVSLEGAFFTRVNDNTFGSTVESTGQFFGEDAQTIGIGVSHSMSNQLLLRNNYFSQYRNGLLGIGGVQYLTTSKSRFLQNSPVTWVMRSEVEGRNTFYTDPSLVNGNRYLEILSGTIRRNNTTDIVVDLPARTLLVCGYNDFAKHSANHLGRWETEEMDPKVLTVDYNEWNSLNANQQEEYRVRYVVGDFDPIGNELDHVDVVNANCGALQQGADAFCYIPLFDDLGSNVRFNDGGFNDKYRVAYIVESDLDTALSTMSNPSYSVERRYEAIGDALQLVLTLADTLRSREFESECDTIVKDTTLDCYLRWKAEECRILSLSTFGQHVLALSEANQLRTGYPCVISDTASTGIFVDVVAAGLLNGVDSTVASKLALIERNATERELSRLHFDSLFQKPGIDFELSRRLKTWTSCVLTSIEQDNILTVTNTSRTNTPVSITVSSLQGKLLAEFTTQLESGSSVQYDCSDHRGAVIVIVSSSECRQSHLVLVE